MTRIYRPRNRAAGFTLVEMLVVMAIIGLLAAVTIARLPSAASAARVRNVDAALREAAARARARAMTAGAPTVLSAPAKLADASKVTVDTSGGQLLFFADGSSNGGVVRLDGRPLFTVDWLTGAVHDPR